PVSPIRCRSPMAPPFWPSVPRRWASRHRRRPTARVSTGSPTTARMPSSTSNSPMAYASRRPFPMHASGPTCRPRHCSRGRSRRTATTPSPTVPRLQMTSPISVTRNGHRTFFKWHRARRHGTDPVFTGRRVLEGMALGASVEVDLVVHGGGGMAVLHDLALDRETTGTGPVRKADAASLRSLHLRDEEGTVLEDRVMLLEDLAALVRRDGAHPDALLQLDYKEDAAA